MNSFFLVTQSFSPHRSLVNLLKIHFPMKYTIFQEHETFFGAFFTSKMIPVPPLTVVVVACVIFIHGFSRCRGYWIWVFCCLFSCVYICSSSISLHHCYCCLPSTTYHNCLCRGYLILHYPICKFQSLVSFWIECDIPSIEVDTK